jgi:hypothetical protein
MALDHVARGLLRDFNDPGSAESLFGDVLKPFSTASVISDVLSTRRRRPLRP